MSRSEHRQIIAAEVRAAVARKRVRLDELSAATGIARSTLSNKINGNSDFTVSELVEVAIALDVSAAEFLPSATAVPA